MKKLFLSFAALSLLGFTACKNDTTTGESAMDSTAAATEMADNSMTTTTTTRTFDGTYTDLSTGKSVQVRRDDSKGYMVDASTGAPIEFFVDMNTRDTFYGKTGTVVNNAIMMDEGTYKLDDAKIKWDGEELKVKGDDSKEKITNDEYKYKDGDTKIKDNENEYKAKSGDAKLKANEDGYKYKDNDIKVKANKNEVKVKSN